jgi:hypothetical protein
MARQMEVVVERPDANEPIAAVAGCLPGEQVIGGGSAVTISDPTEFRFHLLSDGPTPTGWMGLAAATGRFNQGVTFTLTTTVYCLGAP